MEHPHVANNDSITRNLRLARIWIVTFSSLFVCKITVLVRLTDQSFTLAATDEAMELEPHL